jgi:hypothetical protein
MVGLDLDARRQAIADDEFARRRAELGGSLAEPYSTTRAAGQAF